MEKEREKATLAAPLNLLTQEKKRNKYKHTNCRITRKKSAQTHTHSLKHTKDRRKRKDDVEYCSIHR